MLIQSMHMNTLQLQGSLCTYYKAEGHCYYVNYLWSIQIYTVLYDFRTYVWPYMAFLIACKNQANQSKDKLSHAQMVLDKKTSNVCGYLFISQAR